MNLKKLLTMTLALIMVVTSLIGCGTAKKESSTAKTEEQQTTEAPATQKQETTSAEEEKKETPVIKILMLGSDGRAFSDLSENETIKKMEEAAGVETEWEIIQKSNWDTQINLIMSNPEGYPDVIIGPDVMDVEKYGVDQGILIPLDEWIAEYMSNYTDRIAQEETDPTVNLVASDGHVYGLGQFESQKTNTANPYFLNKVWMEALGLEHPKNVEELTDVLRAFKTKDPNGNGQADEIPMSMEIRKNSVFAPGQMLALFGIPYGSPNHWLYVDDNKQVQLVPEAEGFRECMEWLHACYKEGLLDIETLSQDEATIAAKVTEAKVGFMSAYRLIAIGYGDDAINNYELYVPGEGTKAIRTMELAANRIYVTNANEHVAETMKFLNAWLEDENMFSLYYGAYQETMNPDEPGWYYTDAKQIGTVATPPEMPVFGYPAANGWFFAPGNYIFDLLVQPAHRIERMEYCQTYTDAGILQKYSNTWLSLVKLTADQAAEKALVETDLDKAMNEYMSRFISDGVTDDNWNAFMDVLKGMNLQERYVKMYQEGLDKLDIE